MCGFAGFLSLGSNPLDATVRRGILTAMGQAIAHRGPDDEQYFDDGVLSLVFRRLSIVDTQHGVQPIFSEDRSTLLVANGEIYNHLDLRRKLSGNHVFSSNSDCEALLHAYENWGLGAFEQCRGMFAAALWERNTRRLILARDRLGIKPLYLFRAGKGFVFASELKALLAHPACPREIDLAALEVSPLSSSRIPTYIKGVEFLPAASYMVIDQNGGTGRRNYWEMASHFGHAPYGNDKSRYIDTLQDLVEESVIEHLQGESQVAIHLSGGLDSAMLAAIISRQKKDTPCYTIVERTTSVVGDVASARLSCQQLGLPWFPVLFDYRSILDEMQFDLSKLEESVWMMDSPRIDLEWLMKEELTRVIRQQHPEIKTLIIGQGADEFSGGYSRRVDMRNLCWQSYLTNEISPMISRNTGPDRLGFSSKYSSRETQARSGAYHQAMLLFTRQLQHHNLWHEDRTSAWHGMEARVPFLDHRIVELLVSIPDSLHHDLFWDKKIFRECIRKIFPEFNADRPKVGFCCTNDVRSINIIVHGMATRTAAPFLEKYLSSEHYPFDRKATRQLAHNVLNRGPGFYGDSFRLLEHMAVTIFAHQFGAANLIPAVSRRHRPFLSVIAAERMPIIERRMRESPVIKTRWRPGDRLCLPEGAAISCLDYPDGKMRFLLVKDGVVYSEMEVFGVSPWLPSFMRNLGRGMSRTFSIQDWADEFDLGLKEFTNALDMLYQSGFIVAVRQPSGEILEPQTASRLAP